MKKIYYFYSLLLTALFLLPWSGVKADPSTLTVADGTYLKQRLPMYGYYGDEAQHNQFIFLSSELSDMNGATIKALTFYMDKNYTWRNNNAPTATFRFAEVTATTVASMITVDETFTQVFSGTIVFANNEWNITLDNAYTYNGGNLLIDVQTTAAQYINNNSNKGSYFYSANVAYGRGNYNGSSAQEYIPKTTFTYEILGCTTPKDLNAEQYSSTAATVTWSKGANEDAWQLRYREKTEPESSWSSLIDVTTTPARNLTGLTTDKTYEVQVRSNCGGDDYSEWSESAEFPLVSCPTVTGVTLSGKVYNGVTVYWTTSAPGNCDVQYKEAGDADWTSAGTNLEGSSKAITGLVVGKTYSFQVKPNCSADGWVAAGETYTPAFPTPDPSVSAKTDATATITWDAVMGATGYKCLYVLKDAAAPNAAAWAAAETLTGLSASLTSLAGGTDYDVYVLAVFATGESDPEMVALQTTTIAPTALVQEGDATTSSIAFSWSYAGAATQFQWKSSKEGSVWSDPISVLTATETGLSAGTSYTFYVRAYYSATVQSAELSGSLKTECGTETLPKTFSSWTAIPNCWYTLQTSDGAYDLPTVYSGELKFYGNNSSSTKSRKAVLVLPKFEKDIQKLQVEVEYQNGGSDNNNYPQFIVGYVTDPENVNTFNTISLLNRYPSTSSYTTCDPVDLSSAPTGAHIAIAYGNPNSTKSSGLSYPYAYIKTIKVSEKVSCPVPTDLAAVATADGADVTWTAGASETAWNLRYSVKDADSWTTVENLSATNHTLTGLSTANIYEVQVQAACGVGDESAWSASAEFQPACLAPINLHTTSLAYNAATIEWTRSAKALRYKTGSDAWTVETISPAANSFALSQLTAQTTYSVQVKAECEDDDIWSDEFEFTTKCAPITIVKGTPFEEGFSSWPSCWEQSEGTYPQVVSSSLQFYANTGDSYQEVIFPSFTNDIETLTLSFEHKNSYGGTTYGGTLQIGYIKPDGTFVNRETLTPSTSYATYENVITKANPEDVVANYAIRYTATYDYARVYIDNVKVFVAPTCYAPATLSDATSITSEGATFTWTASGHGETQYQYCIDGDWSNATITSVLTATVTGLNPQTNYTFYVRSYCAGDDQSDAISKAFTTECASIPVAAMPFEEDFIGLTDVPECWTTHKGTYYNIYVDNEKLHFNSGKTATLQTVALPKLDAALADLAISFDYKGSEGSNYGKVQVGYLTDKKDNSTFVAVGDPLTVAASFKQAVVPFAGVSADAYIAIRYTGGTSEGDLYVDNIRVATTLALADADDNSATLNNNLGQTLDVVIGRTLICDGDFNTLCLPFDLPSLAGTPLAGGELWAFKYANVENGELLVRIIEAESIEAGKPYLITFPSGSDIENLLFKNVTISASAGVAVGDEAAVQFIGILKPEAFTTTGEDVHKKLFVAANGHLAWAGVANELKSFRAYFQTTENVGGNSVPSSMPARIVKHDPTITGVENVGGEVHAIKVLENNQVVIIRNGVKYTIQGQVFSK